MLIEVLEIEGSDAEPEEDVFMRGCRGFILTESESANEKILKFQYPCSISVSDNSAIGSWVVTEIPCLCFFFFFFLANCCYSPRGQQGAPPAAASACSTLGYRSAPGCRWKDADATRSWGLWTEGKRSQYFRGTQVGLIILINSFYLYSFMYFCIFICILL